MILHAALGEWCFFIMWRACLFLGLSSILNWVFCGWILLLSVWWLCCQSVGLARRILLSIGPLVVQSLCPESGARLLR